MTQFTPNKWVDGAASGTGNGSQTNPWTMAQAVANANPGDVIQLNPGTITGPNTAQLWEASFPIRRPGTSCAPIVWFAENYAAVSSTGRTTFAHPGAAPNGDPVIGLNAPYNYLYGIHVYEPNAVPGNDTGSIVITAPHVKLSYCHLDRAQANWPAYTNQTEVPTNLSGVRIEPSPSEDVFDVQITDNLFTNYTAASDVLYGTAAVQMFSIPGYYCHDVTFENNTFDNINCAVYIKGAGVSREVKGGLVFRRNLSRVSESNFGPNHFHYNLSDTDETYGPNVFVQNLAYGGDSFIRISAQGDGQTKSAYLINNTAVSVFGGGEDGFLRDYYQGNQGMPTWRIQNNIFTGTRFYNFAYSGGDHSVQWRDYNTAYQLSGSYSSVGEATPPIGDETLGQLQQRTGQETNSVIRDPLFASTTWGDPQLGKLQTGSNERESGVDILDLQNTGVTSSINRGCFIKADMSDQIGIRALPSGLQTSQDAREIETITVTHNAVGTNRHVLIGVMSGAVPASVTYGTQTPTLLRSEGPLHLYSLLNPDTGPRTVSAVSSIGITNQALLVASRPNIASVGTAVSNTNSEQPTIGVTVASSPGNLVADFAFMVRPEMAASAGQTERISMDDPGIGYLSLGMSDKPGASSVAMQWETDETYGDNAIIAVSLVSAV